MKILVTGTHFTPAQAVIEELQKIPDTQIVYIGRKKTMEGDRATSLESQIFPRLHIKYLDLITGKFQKNFNIYTFTSLLKIPVGFFLAFYYLIKEKPDVILSFGGYIGLPVVICGWLLSIPVIIHEQTLVIGLANRISALFADKIAVSFKDHPLIGNNKVIFTGNPLRKEFLENKGKEVSSEIRQIIKKAKESLRPVVLITGGNQGSHRINQVSFNLIPELIQKDTVIHQTGDSKFKDFKKLEKLREALNGKENYLIKKWIDAPDLAFILKNCNVVVSRAGVNTLFEIAYLQKKAIVIPLPFLYQNEQVKNAKYFSRLGFIKVLYEENLTPEALLKMLNLILKESFAQKDNASEIYVENASKVVALETLLLGVGDA